MAKWGEIKCERCAEQDALWEGMERALEESDAREARLEARITMLEEHLCLTEEKLAKAVALLGQWRLASAGYVSVRSVMDKHDATLAELLKERSDEKGKNDE